MDNQHRQIKGYRELSQEEINLMNEIKENGEYLNSLCDKLAAMSNSKIDEEHKPDMRWISIGKTHLQQGIMALVRSVAKPTTF